MFEDEKDECIVLFSLSDLDGSQTLKLTAGMLFLKINKNW